MDDESRALLGLFGEKEKPDHIIAWQMYQKGVDFKDSINLYDCVKVNENFFVGKQWEGVEANGLPTPVFNVIKRVVTFITATITSDNIKVTATPMANVVQEKEVSNIVDVVNNELEYLFERNRVPALTRKFARNAAVDGDGCTYTYWDPDAESGQENKGMIVTEVVENKRVHFGNPSDASVQSQPYIIIEKREPVRNVRRRAKENGSKDWAGIVPDEDNYGLDDAKRNDDLVTVLMLFWKDDDTGEVWGFECTKTCDVKKPTAMGIHLYPITWLNWDYIQDSYHGQAMITGLIPNQIFINKSWAMSMLSIMRTAFPKYIYNKTMIPRLDNRIGGAIGVAGGNLQDMVKIVDPATISPQVSQLIQLAVDQTEQTLGATSVALGDTRPDNTSAIIALQRAAATPSEMTKQNLYEATEDLSNIYFEFMAAYYGKRQVMLPTPPEIQQMFDFIGQPAPAKVPQEFDYAVLSDHPMLLKLDVGASTYYSEIAAMQTLNGLLDRKLITLRQFLERVSDDYVPKRRALLEEIVEQERQAELMQQQMAAAAAAQQQAPAPPGESGGGEEMLTGGPMGGGGKMDIPQTAGYSAMHRQINNSGSVEGIV